MGNVPTRNRAITMLEEAKRLNPGQWVQHSRYVGEAAALIAGHCDGMDAEKAYVLGLLHDIGRRVGKTNGGCRAAAWHARAHRQQVESHLPNQGCV